MCCPSNRDRPFVARLLRALRWAAAGLFTVWRVEEHFRWQVAAALGAFFLARWVAITRIEWVALVLTVALVLIAQVLNWVVEQILGLMVTEYHPIVGRAKDAAAGAVLVAACAAVCVFALTVGPRLGSVGGVLRGAWESRRVELILQGGVVSAVLWLSLGPFRNWGSDRDD